MRRIDMILLFLIFSISLPVVSGFAYRPDAGNDRLNTYAIESSSSWANVNDNEPKGNLGTKNASFTLGSMMPGCQQKTSWVVDNSNSFECYLDLEKINITSNENGCLEPEIDAGDTTPDEGELNSVVWVSLFIDKNRDESFNDDDFMIYKGEAGAIDHAYDLNESISAGNDIQITALFEWTNTVNCNVAMGDDLSMDMSFELSQTAGQ